MARLPYPECEIMPAEIADLVGSIPRNNITEMLAHATSLLAPWLRLAQAQFTALELGTRQRELVILAVAGLVDCEYEYVQHVPVSEAAGIDTGLRERVRDGDLDAPDDPAERALLAFVAAVVGAPRAGEEVFEAVRRHLTARQIVEVLQLVGFYWGLGRVCTVLELELDHPAGLESITAVSDLPG
jgi:alkylhydroperoxidase family enzyme